MTVLTLSIVRHTNYLTINTVTVTEIKCKQVVRGKSRFSCIKPVALKASSASAGVGGNKADIYIANKRLIDCLTACQHRKVDLCRRQQTGTINATTGYQIEWLTFLKIRYSFTNTKPDHTHPIRYNFNQCGCNLMPWPINLIKCLIVTFLTLIYVAYCHICED